MLKTQGGAAGYGLARNVKKLHRELPNGLPMGPTPTLPAISPETQVTITPNPDGKAQQILRWRAEAIEAAIREAFRESGYLLDRVQDELQRLRRERDFEAALDVNLAEHGTD